MVKLFLVLLLLSLGALNRYRILLGLSQDAGARAALIGDRTRRLLTTVTLEIGLGLAILVCVALLLQLPPARGQLGSDYKASAHPMNHMGQGETHPSKLQPAEGAKVTILSPKEGQVFKGDEVPISYKFVKGKRGSHIHAYVDGELIGMFTGEKGTLTGVRPGHHTLEVRVVAEDHETELDAIDRVDFVVE